jgi:PST family polysaccharide transporter
MLRFGGNVTATNLLYHFSSNMDQILIGKFFGAAPLGIYRQGINLVSIPLNGFSQPVISVGESALCRLQGDSERFRRFYRKILIGLSSLTMPIALFLAVYADELVLIALGPNWTDVGPILRIMAIAGVLAPVDTTTGAVMIACGLSRRIFQVGIFTSLTLVLFVAASIPFGVEAVALAHVWEAYLLLIPKLYWAFKGTPVTVGGFFKGIGHSLLAGLFMVGVLLVIREMVALDRALARVALGSLVGLLSYLAYWMAIPGARTQLAEITGDIIAHSPLKRFIRGRSHG